MEPRYDDELWKGCDKFIGVCAKCSREGYKRNMHTIYIREPKKYSSPKTLCHICPRCLPALLDELEVSMPE